MHVHVLNEFLNSESDNSSGKQVVVGAPQARHELSVSVTTFTAIAPHVGGLAQKYTVLASRPALADLKSFSTI